MPGPGVAEFTTRTRTQHFIKRRRRLVLSANTVFCFFFFFPMGLSPGQRKAYFIEEMGNGFQQQLMALPAQVFSHGGTKC